jgi:hypothetical protein
MKKRSAKAIAERVRRERISKDALVLLTPQQRGEIQDFAWEEFRQWGPDVSSDTLERHVTDWMEYAMQRGFAAFERSRARQRKFERLNGRLPGLVALQISADLLEFPDPSLLWYAEPRERKLQLLDPDDPGDQTA